MMGDKKSDFFEKIGLLKYPQLANAKGGKHVYFFQFC